MTDLPARATTGDHVAFHAAERPDGVALVNRGRAISYAELCRDIGKFASALREFGLPRGSAVAVGCDDFYLHWVLLLAFERLNVATASYHSGEGLADCGELLAGADLVLSEEHFPLQGAARHRSIAPAWVADTLARSHDGGPIYADWAAGDPVRILRSSGTTGRPKRLVVTRGMNEPRIAGYAWQYQFTPQSRYLLTLPFSAGPMYGAATACLRAGGTVVTEPFEGGAGAARAIARHGITHVMLQPIMLKRVLDDLPRDLVKPARLTIVTLGSALSDELSARALEHLATEVTDVFGCNEVGGVSRRQATRRDKFSEVSPGVEVETIDESNRLVPRGEPGLLRIRTEAMVEGYLGEPEELTRRHFRNGWFYPGDRAILDGPRRLMVVGRGDELLNIGGAKVRPDDLEALVMRHADVGDVGICTFGNREGIEEVYVALAGVRHDHRELLARLEQAFMHQQLGSFRVVILQAIPRNAAGKIVRAALKEMVAKAAGLNRRGE
ncbi:MAG TPA: class I adenylate-forming enzyme family protein [Stellaceae bacterium]|nr:class I adenylate-forming enzyme family protein [Stellaceae bacterium]